MKRTHLTLETFDISRSQDVDGATLPLGSATLLKPLMQEKNVPIPRLDWLPNQRKRRLRDSRVYGRLFPTNIDADADAAEAYG